MRLTKRQLRLLINEEVKNLSEAPPRRPLGRRNYASGFGVKDDSRKLMKLADLIASFFDDAVENMDISGVVSSIVSAIEAQGDGLDGVDMDALEAAVVKVWQSDYAKKVMKLSELVSDVRDKLDR